MTTKKEIEKRMLIKRTITAMEKQIKKLEEQKQVYIDAGKQAKAKGLSAQYNLALSGLRMTIAQQRRVYEMKLNFEITSQMKDMTQMTSEFLQGMGSLSKDMMKLTNYECGIRNMECGMLNLDALRHCEERSNPEIGRNAE